MRNPRRLHVTQVRSTIGTLLVHKECVRGLGLRRIGHTVEVEDTPSIRGMIRKARHLVQVSKASWDWTRLSESEHAQLRRIGTALSEVPMRFATPIYFADLTKPADEESNINNGTATLIRINGEQFCITARHVLEGYRKRVAENQMVRLAHS